jgi:hypothetical protein
VSITWTFASVAQHWEVFSEMAGPVERVVATLSSADRARLKEKLAGAIAPFVVEGGAVRIPGTQLCVSGARGA